MLTPQQLESYQALRDDVRQKLRRFYGPGKIRAHHAYFLSVESLLDEADQLQREVERLNAELAKYQPAKQIGWLGPYGIVPGGMDNEPAENWKPIYAHTTN